MMVSICDARGEPASVGLKSFSSGMGRCAGPCRFQTSSRAAVVKAYSSVRQTFSPGIGRWYLHDGATSVFASRAALSASAKNPR